MRSFFGILNICLCASTAIHAGDDSFYVWQQQWSSNVLTAVQNEPETTLYPLACVIPNQGPGTLPAVPWNALSTLTHDYVPVIRIPLGAFRRTDLNRELNTVTARLAHAMPPLKLKEIQLDLDCPERLLPRYLEVVRAYRQHHPELRLSITALPAHLRHKAFRELAEATDYYVIQVHGINVPRTREDRAELLNRKTADKALRQAEHIGHPFRVALPCYAYELNYDPVDGSFLFLTAEKTTRRTDTQKQRIAAAHTDLVGLQQQIGQLTHAKGIIWFRLPVEGDRLCLPRPALTAIQSGKLPKTEVECRIRPVNTSTIELELFNANTIHAHEATIKLNWPRPNGASDLYHGISAVRPSPGRLPTEITVAMPPPSRAITLGWFRVATNDHPRIEIILK